MCFECDAPAKCKHHVVPKVYGGTRTVPLCESCHHKAHGRDGRAAWTSVATRAALAAKKARGECVGTVPLGMARDGGRLVENDDEAAALATIRALRADGLSIRRIAEELNRQHVPCRGTRWHPTTVARVLRQGGGEWTPVNGG